MSKLLFLKIFAVLLLALITFQANSQVNISNRINVPDEKDEYVFFTENQGRLMSEVNILPDLKTDDRGTSYYEMEFSFNAAKLKEISEQNDIYQTLSIEGFANTGETGSPMLPAKNELILVPFNGKASISIVEISSKEIDNFNIYPTQLPHIDSEGRPDPPFTKNAMRYSSNAYYPDNVVDIVEVQKIRGMEMAFVRICPVQYNPVTKKIKVYSKIKFRVQFAGSNKSFDKIAELSSTNYLNKLQRKINNNKFLPDYNIQSSGPPIDGVTGPSKNYIIITHDQYLTAAEDLAQWKRQMGYSVEVVSQASWTSAQVKTAIHDRYTNWSPKPDYFVIIGDHDGAYAVPGEEYTAPDTSQDYATDLYYACMDGAGDYVPDMTKGRISVSSLTDANIFIQKIIDYEKNPIDDATFYSTALNCAQYQDDDDNGYADRRFCHTSEDIRDYVMGQGFTVNRVYKTTSGAPVTTLRYNNDTYSNGELLTADLRSGTFDWAGDDTDIDTEIEAGRFYVLHRDHGYQGGSGWASPYYTTTSLNNLSNGDKLPVVFSINCHTGEYYQSNCFAEKFTRMSGGAVGVIGAACYSYSGHNDAYVAGMFDAIWPSPGLTPTFGNGGVVSPPASSPTSAILTMGDVVNQGLIRMMETWAWWSADFEYTHRLFHYFGDPAMKMWTANPNSNIITATHPTSASQTTMTITTSNCTDALATLTFNGELLGSTTLSGGTGVITYSTASTGNAVLTLSKHNWKPYIAYVSIVTNTDMAYSETVTTQSNTDAIADGINQEIVGIEVEMNGGMNNALAITSFLLNTNGSDYASTDITNAKLYYTGLSDDFETTAQFGSTSTGPDGSFSITGSQTLYPGTNYFWLTYDVPSGATYANDLDAECNQLTIGGSDYIPTKTAPIGERPISINSPYCSASYLAGPSGQIYISRVQLEDIDNPTGESTSSPYYEDYMNISTDLKRNESYSLTMWSGNYTTGNTMAAWIDFDGDGLYEASEKLGQAIVDASFFPLTMNFTVPLTATISKIKMRTRIVYSNPGFILNPCYTYNNGETEDYTINILPECSYTFNTFPYSEDFSTELSRDCWTINQISGTGNWAFATTTVSPVQEPASGSSMVLFNSSSYSSGTESRLESPSFDLTAISNPYLSCYLHRDNTNITNNDRIEVYVSTDGGTIWTLLETWSRYHPMFTNDWIKHDANLAAYTSQSDVKIGLKAISENGSDIAIDKFEIISSSCAVPTSPTTDQITDISARYNWTAGAGTDGYVLKWALDDGSNNFCYALASGQSTSEYSASNLQAGTNYFWQIRSYCGSYYGPTSSSQGYGSNNTFSTTGSSCDIPGTLAPTVSIGNVRLQWSASANATEYYIKYRENTSGSTFNYKSTTNTYIDLDVDNSSPSVDYLQDNTNYIYYVRAQCGTNVSIYPYLAGNFTTLAGDQACPGPNSLINTVSGNSAILSWDALSGASEYIVKYRISGGNYIYIKTNSNSLNIDYLQTNVTYEWQVKGECNSGYSSYNAVPKTFTTTECLTPDGFNALATQNSALLTWNAVPGAVNYYVKYKTENGNFIFDNTSNNYIELFNLLSDTEYDWYIRTDCQGIYSSYPTVPEKLITSGSITLLEENDATIKDLKIYPNPTKANTYVSFYSTKSNSIEISITELTGRLLSKETLSVSKGENQHEIKLNLLSKGMYIIRIQGDDIDEFRRLVIH